MLPVASASACTLPPSACSCPCSLPCSGPRPCRHHGVKSDLGSFDLMCGYCSEPPHCAGPLSRSCQGATAARQARPSAPRVQVQRPPSFLPARTPQGLLSCHPIQSAQALQVHLTGPDRVPLQPVRPNMLVSKALSSCWLAQHLPAAFAAGDTLPCGTCDHAGLAGLFRTAADLPQGATVPVLDKLVKMLMVQGAR